MKGLVVNCKTGETKTIDDGQPFPQFLPPIELTIVDLVDLKRLIEYAKTQEWI